MTAISGGIISLEFAREGLNWKNPTAGMDADLIALVQAATPVIENIVGPVLAATKVRKFDGGNSHVMLPHIAATVTQVKELQNVITDWFYDPIAGILYGGSSQYPRFFYPGIQAIEITYTVGYASIPQNIQFATRELVRHWVQQGKQSNRPSFDDVANSGVPGLPPGSGFGVPPRVYQILQSNTTAPGFA